MSVLVAVGLVAGLLAVAERERSKRTLPAVRPVSLVQPSPDGLTGNLLEPVEIDTRLVAGDPSSDSAQWKVRVGVAEAIVARRTLADTAGACVVAAWVVVVNRTQVPGPFSLASRVFSACRAGVGGYGELVSQQTGDSLVVVNFIRLRPGACACSQDTVADSARLRRLGATNAVDDALREGNFQSAVVVGVPGSTYGTARQAVRGPNEASGDGTGAAFRASGLNVHGRLAAGADGRYALLYRVEVSDDPAFTNPTLVQEVRGQQTPTGVVTLTPAVKAAGQFVRLTATKLRPLSGGRFALLLAEMEVNGQPVLWSAASQVAAGGYVSLQGSGWAPVGQVKIELCSSSSPCSPLGTVAPSTERTFGKGVVVPITTAAGAYTLKATQNSLTASVNLPVIRYVTATVTPSVAPGGTVQISGKGWTPGAVSVQLCDSNKASCSASASTGLATPVSLTASPTGDILGSVRLAAGASGQRTLQLAQSGVALYSPVDIGACGGSLGWRVPTNETPLADAQVAASSIGGAAIYWGLSKVIDGIRYDGKDNLGYRSMNSELPRVDCLQVKRLPAAGGQLDPVRSVSLYPAQDLGIPTEMGYLFPRTYRVEVSDDPTFTTGVTVLASALQEESPGNRVRFEAPGSGVSGRYVRVTVTGMRKVLDTQSKAFALSEVVVNEPNPTVSAAASVPRGQSLDVSTGGWPAGVSGVTAHLCRGTVAVPTSCQPLGVAQAVVSGAARLTPTIPATTSPGTYVLRVQAYPNLWVAKTLIVTY